MIQLKRVYEPYSKEDGYRILVDRLWPRGLTKEKAKVDLWLKDIAPSIELRKWFGHDPKKWEGFRDKYRRELKDRKILISQLKDSEKKYGKITLLYGARDTQHNEALVLIDILR